MTLTEYVNFVVNRSHASQQDIANTLGLGRAYLNNILSGRRRPSFPLMVQISIRSDGLVPVTSWVAQ